MARRGFGGVLDTPRTNLGDATYLSQQPDFADISQEASFQSPNKDDNLLQQLRNGRSNGVNLRTPRQRGPLADRRNLPVSIGGGEFTPLLKSATRNSVRRRGKENGADLSTTPGLGRIEESDLTPRADMSTFTASRNQSYVDATLPQVDVSSTTSTPLAIPKRRGGDKGPLQDGNQLSLREQENVIDRIEKENFGLKLKIHFLEDALRKAGPGFSEAALKENTELKVDKVTMQRELHRYKKHLTTAERDLESYRQQMMELQEKAKRKYADENQRAEMDKLRQTLDDREADLEDLQRQLSQGQKDDEQLRKLRDDIEDLEAELRDKDRVLTEREDELEDMKDKFDEADEKAKDALRKIVELEQAAQNHDNEELEEARGTIEDLEEKIRRLEDQLEDAKEKMEEAVAEKNRAEGDLQELQEEMVDKSMVTKGLSRQTEEKIIRLQDELDSSSQEYAKIEKQLTAVNRENEELRSTIQDLQKQQSSSKKDQQSGSARIQELEEKLLVQAEDKDLLQSRHDSLASEAAALQREMDKLEKEMDELEQSLAEEREHALEIEKDLRNQYQDEIQRLNDEISDLQAEIREKDNLYDNDSEKWETEKQTLESEKNRAEEKAAGLQRTIDRLRDAEGALSDKESKLQAAIHSEAERHKSEEGVLTRQVEDLQDALETRQTLLTGLRNELSAVRDELRQTQVDYKTQSERVAALEDEVEVLQTTLDDEAGPARQELQTAKKECEELRAQLVELQRSADSARSTTAASDQKAQASSESAARLKWELSDAKMQLERVGKEKQSLQDQVANSGIELHKVRSSLAEVEAERDELNTQLRRSRMQDNDTLRVDQERLDLRTAKLKLDNEVRRLKEENRMIKEQQQVIQKTLEDEIEKAAEEEERLSQEILQLQSKLRQSSSTESQDLVSARRTIRELERRIEEHQMELAVAQVPGGSEGNSELSVMRRDLSSARQKELEFLQRESGHRDAVKDLKKRIAELERQLHDKEITRLITSPRSISGGLESDDREAAALRQQLTAALKSLHETKTKSREAERKASQATQDLMQQLNDSEDQKLVLEEVLEHANQQAEEAVAQHERTLQRLKHKLEKAERERVAALASQTDTSKHERHLRRTQAEVENLEHDVRQQQELIDGLVASEASLRRKLERTRSERAAYRMSTEKLQRDMQRLRSAAAAAAAVTAPPGDKHASRGDRKQRAMDKEDDRQVDNEALETLIRAAEGAEDRHKKELRGMVMQMEWMQARWEREASLRADAAFAKKFVQLQLDVANACNKAQLRELEHIRTKLLGSRKALPAPGSSSDGGSSGSPAASKPRQALRRALLAARFVARMRVAARGWAAQEVVRRKLAAANEEQRRSRKARQLKVVRVEA
ncbi:hypothetical protein HJFPF1_12885 [Paramyrothecium foliicola]|nr:hypothetical protein HJFPF1_12885 [Paramyrothecium foliicola]